MHTIYFGPITSAFENEYRSSAILLPFGFERERKLDTASVPATSFILPEVLLLALFFPDA